ncbi:hypothetical protein [Natrinema soli]|uniref:Halobacterial output domain-containing protein n=1 Tax=Natrinema soli TaxID=1930624 RepID=A0ABD5SFA0_9EURY|nr:hypothetical protein [Natrinema soli]
MSPDSTVMLALDTASALRSWLRSASQHDALDPTVADSLADLAGAIDSQLHSQVHDQAESLELSVSTTQFPPDTSSSRADHSRCAEDKSADLDTYPSPRPETDDSAETEIETDTGTKTEPCESDPSQIYDELPAHAWNPDTAKTDGSSTTEAGTNAPERDDRDTPSPSTPGSDSTPDDPDRDREALPPAEYVTAYECDVCSVRREMETSVKVCAFVADCQVCNAIDVRFSAVEIPTPIPDHSRHG